LFLTKENPVKSEMLVFLDLLELSTSDVLCDFAENTTSTKIKIKKLFIANIFYDLAITTSYFKLSGYCN
jgi:hypothetical protein